MRKFVRAMCHPGVQSAIGSIMVLLLTIALVACGGDSGTSVNDDNMSSSSSSSVIPASSANRPSSSSKKGDAGTHSSSSGQAPSGMTSSSSSKVSSSSSAKATSSSSVKAVSSSSSVKAVSSSSSVIPASSGNLPSSSSKKVESSSSEYIPFDHSHALAADWEIGENRYKTFVDSRNGRSYYYITITGRDTNLTTTTITVMAENLNVGKMVLGKDNQNDDGAIERYCYNNDTTYCDEFGGLYQWAEMMQLPSRCNTESCADLIQPNHQGICPDGWRLFTYNDYRIVRFSEGNEERGVAGLRSGYRFSGYNTTGFSLVGAGLRTANGGFDDLLDVVYWVYPEEHEYDVAEYAYAAYVARDSDDGTGTTRNRRGEKKSGRAVRCVKLE
ncbi:FISUMP domain-containing protein [uncultured Fibrobacter sp.]|uniref:FISUMP domain-containing protein n=1 Tax=uncultured Fibrobacter sp. TaxID=261512 RepID=UPI0026012413|nr:FISUMP domain-containing protein [uncultured Fibrobacter sp.]